MLLALAIVGLFFLPDPLGVIVLAFAAVIEVAEVHHAGAYTTPNRGTRHSVDPAVRAQVQHAPPPTGSRNTDDT